MNARRKQETVKGTAAELAAGNSIFPLGFHIYETDSTVVKEADGVTAYNALPNKTGAQVFTTAEKTKLANQSNTNTGDETSSTILSKIGDGTKINATYLPSYVDDVLEYANAAARPATGETGKLYVTLDDNKVFRWGGSAYVEIQPSPGTTDSITDVGATNKYWTNARTISSTLTGYAKAATAAALAAGDTILAALGKLEKLIDGKEDAFTKNTAFNKNFGTTAGTIMEGNTTTDATLVFVPGQFSEVEYATDDFRLSLVDQFEDGAIGYWEALANSATIDPIAMSAPSYGGTPTARTITSDTFYKAKKRVAIVGANTAGAAARAYSAAFLFRGDTALFGGFDVTVRFGTGVVSGDTAFTAARTFAGLHSGTTGISATVEPSSLFNTIGVGNDSTDANLQLIYNDGSGTASKIDLGVGFPPHTLETDLYRARFRAVAGSADVHYTVTNETTGATVSGVISTNLPAATTLLALHVWKSNNAVAKAAVMDVFSAKFKNTVLV